MSAGAQAEKFARTGWGAVFSGSKGQNALPKKWAAAGDDPLYRRFARGPVLGGTAGDEASGTGNQEVQVWRKWIEAALEEADGELPWPELRDEVVKRRRKAPTSEAKAAGSNSEALWPHLALAHVPEAYLSHEDAVVRRVKKPKTG